jgi:hypothetical protein
MKVRGVNKSKGTKLRMGMRWIEGYNDAYGRSREYCWLLKGSKAKGTLKHRKLIKCDGEWWPVRNDKWRKVE